MGRECKSFKWPRGEASSRFIAFGIGKSVIINLPADIKDVLVADPKIANAVMRSSRRAYLIGVAVGQTNIFFFDADGRQLAGFDIAVTRDLNGVRAALKQTMPEADIHIEGVGDGVMLSGSAASDAELQQAYDLATRLVGDGNKVVNGIAVRGRDQVMLKVTVAEVQRDIIKQLGVDLSANFTYGATVVSFNNVNPFTASGQPNSSFIAGYRPPVTSDPLTGLTAPRIGATVRAMDRAGIIRTLAEPNLTAISGETAHFLVGGEFPFPIPGNCATCPPSVEFKKFGVGLIFTPVVLSAGRISIKVMTEVSELSPENQLSFSGDDRSLTRGEARRNHFRGAFRWLDRHGGHDQGTDQTSNKRTTGTDAGARSRHAVQEPRFHQQPNRTDGPRHPVCRARGGAEAAIAA